MRRLSLLLTSLTACMLCATIAHALTIGYGQNDFAEAGAGCVGGWVSDHGNIAYFRGDTELLNTHLTLLASNSVGHSLPKIVLHSGNKVIDNPEERPVTGFISVDQPTDPNPNQLAIDWSVRRYCPFNDVITGRCKCDRRIVTVDIWIANNVDLGTLSIPAGLSVESGREIEQFVEAHADLK